MRGGRRSGGRSPGSCRSLAACLLHNSVGTGRMRTGFRDSGTALVRRISDIGTYILLSAVDTALGIVWVVVVVGVAVVVVAVVGSGSFVAGLVVDSVVAFPWRSCRFVDDNCR